MRRIAALLGGLALCSLTGCSTTPTTPTTPTHALQQAAPTPTTISGEPAAETGGADRPTTVLPQCSSTQVAEALRAREHRSGSSLKVSFTTTLRSLGKPCGIPGLQTCAFAGGVRVVSPQGRPVRTWAPMGLGRRCLSGLVQALPISITTPAWVVPAALPAGTYVATGSPGWANTASVRLHLP